MQLIHRLPPPAYVPDPAETRFVGEHDPPPPAAPGRRPRAFVAPLSQDSGVINFAQTRPDDAPKDE
jgi:hypothetical protein